MVSYRVHPNNINCTPNVEAGNWTVKSRDPNKATPQACSRWWRGCCCSGRVVVVATAASGRAEGKSSDQWDSVGRGSRVWGKVGGGWLLLILILIKRAVCWVAFWCPRLYSSPTLPAMINKLRVSLSLYYEVAMPLLSYTDWFDVDLSLHNRR